MESVHAPCAVYHMLCCVVQEAASLLRKAADESCDWDTRIQSLSELSYALECEENKYEVAALDTLHHAPSL